MIYIEVSLLKDFQRFFGSMRQLRGLRTLSAKFYQSRGEVIDGLYDAICYNEHIKNLELDVDFGFFSPLIPNLGPCCVTLKSLEALKLVNPKAEGKFYTGIFSKICFPNLRRLGIKFEKYDPSPKAWIELLKMILELRSLFSFSLELGTLKQESCNLLSKTFKGLTWLKELRLVIGGFGSLVASKAFGFVRNMIVP